MRTFKLITRFYGEIFLANFLVTLSCIYLMGNYGVKAYEIVVVLFWYKIITIILIFYTATYHKSNEFYYYQNLGISKLQMVISTSIVDFLLWLAFITLQLLIGIPGYVFNLLLWSVLLIHLYLYIKK
jgi:hypothetical protein